MGGTNYHAVGHTFESRSEPFFIKIFTYRPQCPNGVDFAYVQTG